MTDTSLTPRHLARRMNPGSRKQSRRARPQIEGLEDRVVLSYFPSTASGIHVFEDQLPSGLSAAMTQFVATHTDGTQKELLSETDQLRAINPNYTVMHYQLGIGNSAYEYIINDQWASDFSYVNQQESWFAHQSYSGEPQSAADLASGRVLGNNEDWYQADIANPAWQQYTLNQVFQNMAANGSDAWFADSFTYGIGGAGYDSPIPTRYQGTNASNPADWPGGVTWTDQLGNWAQTIENAFAQHNATYGTDYKFIPNLDALDTSWAPNWYDNANGVPFIDGAFLENFGDATDTPDWTLSMNHGLNLTSNDKIVIMQPYLSSDPSTAAGQQQINFLMGTYLLLQGDQTYLEIQYNGGVQYYPEYQLNLGTPATPPPSNVSSYLWNGVYRRNFQNGFVLVNPGSTTYTLNLGGNYQQVQSQGGGTMTDSQIDANGNYIGGSLTYQTVNSVTLAGGSAAIFLDPAGTTTASATFIKQDATTSGNWSGVYGSQGTDIEGYAAALPSYASVSISSGATPYTFSASTTDTRAPQNPSAPAGSRVAGCWFSTTSFTVDVDLTDGQAHDLALYALDWGRAGRVEQVQISDAASGAVLATQTLSSFGSGAYLVYSVTGHVKITIATKAGANAVLTGLFLDPAGTTTASATFIKQDATTSGNWSGVYGSQGTDIEGYAAALPSYASVSISSGATPYTFSASTTDTRAPQNPSAPAGSRVAGCWFSTTSFTVDVDLTDGQAHDLALYALDWGRAGRVEQVQISDAASGAVLATQTLSSFGSGAYLVYSVTGHVKITIATKAGANAVLTGLFLDPA